MFDDAFWATFWGGLASLAVFAIISAITAWIVNKAKSRSEQKPAWSLATDQSGLTVLKYRRRRRGELQRLVFGNKGEQANTGANGLYDAYDGEPLKRGREIPLPREFEWDELWVQWSELPPFSIRTDRPKAGDTRNVALPAHAKTTIRQRLGNFLLNR